MARHVTGLPRRREAERRYGVGVDPVLSPASGGRDREAESRRLGMIRTAQWEGVRGWRRRQEGSTSQRLGPGDTVPAPMVAERSAWVTSAAACRGENIQWS
jgi:hypothetical protein